MLKVQIKDFQSISSVALDVEGFTVIVGKNNKGKSAIIRAIDAALKNRLGSDFIKWGKTQSEVHLSKDDLDIKWVKGDAASYTINKKSYTKLNRTVPQPILDAGFRHLEIADEKINPLVAHQFEEIFLINKPGSFVTEAISTLYDFNVLNDADILCQKKLRATKNILKTRETDLSTILEKLTSFDGLEELKAKCTLIKEKKKKVEALGQEINNIDKFLTELKSLTNLVNTLKEVAKIKIPKLKMASVLISDYNQLDLFNNKFQESTNTTANFKNLPNIKLPDLKGLHQITLDYSWLKETIDTFKKSLLIVQKLKTIPKKIPDIKSTERLWLDVKTITDLLANLKHMTLSRSKCKKTLSSLKNIDAINSRIPEVQKQINEHSYLKEASKSQENFIESIKTFRFEYESALLTYDSKKTQLDSFKTCPLCNYPLETSL